MPLSLLLLGCGFLLLVIGGVLYVTKKRKIAVACLVVGAVLIAVPPVLVMVSSM